MQVFETELEKSLYMYISLNLVSCCTQAIYTSKECNFYYPHKFEGVVVTLSDC